MKKTILSIAMICGAVIVQAQKPAIPRDAALEAKIEKTLAKMTLDEKIGQMIILFGKDAGVYAEPLRGLLAVGKLPRKAKGILFSRSVGLLESIFFDEHISIHTIRQLAHD